MFRFQDDERHEQSFLFSLREQNPEEAGGDGERGRQHADAFLQKSQSVESQRAPGETQRFITSKMTLCSHCSANHFSDLWPLQFCLSRVLKCSKPDHCRLVFQHTLPLPQGGKHSTNPHLVEDQRFPQQRLSRKARQKTDVFNPDYVAGTSPFCENDIYSRAANLQIRDSQCGGGRRRANPNATRRKFVKKK